MSAEGFVLLTADSRVVRNLVESDAIMVARAVVFMLPTGNLTGSEMGSRFVQNERSIMRKATGPGPAGFVVYERVVSRVFPTP